MKPLVLLTLLLAAAAPVAVDITSPWKARNKSQPDASQGAFVAQTLGLDDWVQISWHRPSVKGRDVWNGTTSRGSALVPRDGEPVPWRAGANEATTIEFTTDVRVQGEALAAGRYALFAIPTDGDWTLIFQSDADQWGSGTSSTTAAGACSQRPRQETSANSMSASAASPSRIAALYAWPPTTRHAASRQTCAQAV